VHAARLGDPSCQAPWAVGRQQAEQLGDGHVRPVFLHEAADTGLAAARAEVAADVDGGEVGGDFAEEDGAFGCLDMTAFLVLPVELDADKGWVVKSTHKNGVIETSRVYESRLQAQTAADGWAYLDEDWAKV